MKNEKELVFGGKKGGAEIPHLRRKGCIVMIVAISGGARGRKKGLTNKPNKRAALMKQQGLLFTGETPTQPEKKPFWRQGVSRLPLKQPLI
ncbi:hypothetical protein JTE90_018520 [Oedothorax gibbosus]|uniref:Uncharacterized protein n=1 Tax=Oedothorax gibbosus TaxID=931172 RepID=A0AAV6UPF0_9ARAC|nr:hypothetical protein JTE90_018520 [Oedothorax gibbosus]